MVAPCRVPSSGPSGYESVTVYERVSPGAMVPRSTVSISDTRSS